MSAARGILVLAVVLTAFVAADHSARPEPDHYALEQWRTSGAAGACAPCGAVCDTDK